MIRYLKAIPLFLLMYVSDIHVKLKVQKITQKNTSRIGGSIKRNGELLVIKAIAPQSKVIFDVGANRGEWCEAALANASSSTLQTIYAFEPVPHTFTKLKEKISNENVITSNIAIGNINGTSKLVVPMTPSAQGASFFDRARFSVMKTCSITVPVRSLDSFCNEHGIEQIDLLKIDTEGAELAVLQGAASLLESKTVSAIQFEYGGTYKDAKIKLLDVYNLLTANGYQIYRISPNGLLEVDKWYSWLEDYKYSNYLALLPSIAT